MCYEHVMRRFLTFCCMAYLAMLCACSESSDGSIPSSNASRAIPVVLAEARMQPMEEVLEVIGTARANESVVLTAKVTEKVSKIHFDDGEFAQKGAVLVEMTNDEESALLNEALANLREQDRNYDRIRMLYADQTVSLSDLDTAETRLRTAQSRVRSIEAQLSDRLILAPFSGLLGLRQVSPGTLVEPADVITTLDDIDPIKADFTVPERFVSRLEVGQRVRASARAYPAEVFEGTVSAMTARVDERTRAVTVRALIPNPEHRLKPGMLLTVQLVQSLQETLAVPESALVPRGSEQFLFVFDPESGTVSRRLVDIGLRIPGLVEIVQGVSDGDLVVEEGVTRITDGARVEPRDAPQPHAGTRTE